MRQGRTSRMRIRGIWSMHISSISNSELLTLTKTHRDTGSRIRALLSKQTSASSKLTRTRLEVVPSLKDSLQWLIRKYLRCSLFWSTVPQSSSSSFRGRRTLRKMSLPDRILLVLILCHLPAQALQWALIFPTMTISGKKRVSKTFIYQTCTQLPLKPQSSSSLSPTQN